MPLFDYLNSAMQFQSTLGIQREITKRIQGYKERVQTKHAGDF